MKPDFERDVHCLFGLPVDAVTLNQACARILHHVRHKEKCLLTTPNLNFLIASSQDMSFRTSVISSHLVIADGMPLIWLSRLLGIPIPERVAGSDLFAMLRDKPVNPKINVYFFGGPAGAADTAAQNINLHATGMICTGHQSPGYLPVHQISSAHYLDPINQADPDFLVIALGARKGQEWIMHNADSLNARVISHLGAVVNFEAGTVSRAPQWMRKTGLEWIWRIHEEPSLWRRYLRDGLAFIRMFLLQGLPLLIFRLRHRPSRGSANGTVQPISTEHNAILTGNLYNPVPLSFRLWLQQIELNQDISIDCQHCHFMDSGYLGLLLLLEQQLKSHEHRLILSHCSASLEQLLKLNRCDHWIDHA